MLDLDMTCVQLRSGLELLHTVQEAMAESTNQQAAYAEALYGVYDYLTMVERQLLDCVRRRQKGG